MSAQPTQSRGRRGCLLRLLLIILFVGACYWLLLSPLPEQTNDPVEEGIPPEPSGQVIIEGDIDTGQQAAIEELAGQSGGQIDVLAETGQIQYLTVKVNVSDPVAASAQEKASYFLQQNRSLFQIRNPSLELKPKGRTIDALGTTFVRYEQEYQGIPIYGSQAIVEVNNSGEIESFIAGYSPNLDIDVQPTIRSTQAESIATQAIGDPNGEILVPTRLVIYDARLFGETIPDKPSLAWDVMIASTKDLNIRSYLVDSQTGEVILSLDEVLGVRDRRVWDAHGGTIDTSNPAAPAVSFMLIFNSSKQVMNENGSLVGATPDEDAQRAWQHAGTVYDYYHSHFERDSLDGAGEPIDLYVNLGNCNGSLWASFFNEPLFCDNVTSLDAVAHELTHGVWLSWGFRTFYKDEAAALNESFSDIFAVFMDDIDPWRITATDSTEDSQSQVIFRNLAEPKRKSYSEYDSNASVYDNSMIHSYAVYLLSEGTTEGEPVNGIEVSGIGRDKAQYIYYDVMAHRLIFRVNFKETRRAAIASCNNLIGRHNITSEDCQEVMNAYAAIGVGEPAIESNPPNPIPAPTPVPPPTSIPAPTPTPDDSDKRWNDLWDTWRENVRQVVDDLLEGTGMQSIWNQLKNVIEEIRSNYWVRLIECINESDQSCINQYVMDLLSFLLETILDAINEFCLSVLFVPATILLYRKRKSSAA